MFENFPYVNFHDLNLDWIISEIKKCYSPDNPPDAVVLSVNGEDGNVILYKDAVVRFPDTEAGTWNIFRKADEQDNGIQFRKNQPAQRIQDAHRYDMYDAGNPPPYPVTSVDGHTGAVATWANTGNIDVLLPHESETDKWALLRDNPSGPLGIQFEVDEDSDEPTGYFILKPEGEEIQKIKILTASDIPSEAGVITVNGSAGIVVLYAGDIKMSANDNTTVKNAIEGAENLTVADYSTVTQYSVGDFCRYLGVMYVCTGSTIGAFNPAKWSTTSASAEIKSVKSHQATDESNITTLQGQMTTANTRIGQNEAIVAYPENGSTASTNYSVGQYIARNGSLYKVIANISAGDQFTGSNISAVDNLGHEVTALNSNIAGIPINNNDDLNNFTSPGTYIVPSSGVAQSLSHRPWNLISNAILEVKSAGSIIFQIVHENYYKHLIQRDFDGTTWSNWYAPVQSTGSWSGNQTLDTLRANVQDTGKSIGYMADTLISGWSCVEAFVSPDKTYRCIEVKNASKIVYTQTNNGGTSWTTGSVTLS